MFTTRIHIIFNNEVHIITLKSTIYRNKIFISIRIILSKGEGKGRILSDAYMITGPALFTIYEVAAYHQELIVLQRSMWQSTSHANG